MTDTQIINGTEPEEQLPKLDMARKKKVFEVARRLKSNTFKLRVMWLEDVKSWGLICSAMIYGQMYDCINFLDDFTEDQHAYMFRGAFSDALKEIEAQQKVKKLITLH